MAIKFKRQSQQDQPLFVPFLVMTNYYGVNDPSVTPAWASISNYTSGEIVKHEGKHFRVVVNHISTSRFQPDNFKMLDGIPDETNHVILSGQVVNNPDSEIYNSSVIDSRGLFPRGAGTNASMQKANGQYFSGSVPGYCSNDKFQGHRMGLNNGLRQFVGGPNNDIQTGTGALTTTHPANTGDPVTDGSNGSPRLSDETAPASFSGWWYMRVV